MTAVCPIKMINNSKGKSTISPANQGFLHSKVSFVLMMDKNDFRKVLAEARDVHSFHISYCFHKFRTFFTSDLPTPDIGKSGESRIKIWRFYKK